MTLRKLFQQELTFSKVSKIFNFISKSGKNIHIHKKFTYCHCIKYTAKNLNFCITKIYELLLIYCYTGDDSQPI